MQLSDIRNNEKFKRMGPDEQEEILDLYQQSVQDEAFAPGQLDMARYVQAQDEVRAAKAELNLQPDPRSTFQRMKDEFVNGMSSSMQAAKALRAVNGLDTPEEAAAALAEQDREILAQPKARSMLKYQKAGGSGWVAPILNIFSNPEAAALIAAQGLGSSVPGMALGAAGSIGTRAAGGGKEAVLLSTMAGVGAGSAFVEGGSKILEDLREQVGDLQDTEAVAAILRDPAKVQEMKNRALARGVTVGAFDAASVALPSSMLFKTAKGLKGLAARGVGDAALQGMLGAAGEVAGSAVIGEESNPADAWAEFIGEMVPGMVELGLGGARTLIPQTEQAAQEKSKNNALFPSQTSAPTIQANKQKAQFGAPRVAPGALAKEAQKAANASVPELRPTNSSEVNDVLNGPEVVDVETLEGVGTPTGSSPEEKMPKPKNKSAFTYLGSGFGPLAGVAESLADQHGLNRGGWKVRSKNPSLAESESDLLSSFDTTENPDEADSNNIKDSDFVVVIGNPDTYKNDIGQSRSRNIATDAEKTFIAGRSANVLIPRVARFLKDNPNASKFTIIEPQNTARFTRGKDKEALIKDAQNIARELFQELGSVPNDPEARSEYLDYIIEGRSKASGTDFAVSASPEKIIEGSINPLRYTTRAASVEALKSQFDPAVDPRANDRVLVFGTDVNGNHNGVYGKIAKELGAEVGKTGLNGRTYGLPVYEKGFKGPSAENNRQGANESFNPREARVQLERFLQFAKTNPGKEYWLMFGSGQGAGRVSTFTETREREIFAGQKIPANVRLLSSTAANIFPYATAPKKRIGKTSRGTAAQLEEVRARAEKTGQQNGLQGADLQSFVQKELQKIPSGGKKSTRSASVPNMDRVLGEAQALDPNDPDKNLSLSARIRNQGENILEGIILSERQARELLQARTSELIERRRKIVGSQKDVQGRKIYNPKDAPGGITKLTPFPFTAFAYSKKDNTYIVKVKNIRVIGEEVEGIEAVGVEEASQTAQTNPQVIELNRSKGKQYLVELEAFYQPDAAYRKSFWGTYERETEVVTQAKANGNVGILDPDDILTRSDAAKPIGAQAETWWEQPKLPMPSTATTPATKKERGGKKAVEAKPVRGFVDLQVQPEPSITDLDNKLTALFSELEQLQAREAQEFGDLSKDGGRNAPKKKGAVNTAERKKLSDRIREITLQYGELQNKIRAQRIAWLESGVSRIAEAISNNPDMGIVIKNSPEWIKASVQELNAVLNSLVNPLDGSLRIYGVRTDYMNEMNGLGRQDSDWVGMAPTAEMAEAKKSQARSSYMNQIYSVDPRASSDPKKTFLPPPPLDIAKYAQEVILDNEERRMGRTATPALRPLTPDQINTLQEAIYAVNSVKPGAKITRDAQYLVKSALEIVKGYAEDQNILAKMYLAVREQNPWTLNFPGTYMQMLAKAIARDPRAGNLANLDIFLPFTDSPTLTNENQPTKVPMRYSVPKEGLRPDLQDKYPNGTTTLQLIQDGRRKGTTRRAFARVGDVISFENDTTKYIVTSVVTPDLRTPGGRAAWESKEGWSLKFIDQDPKLRSQVYSPQSVQTTFEVYETEDSRPGGDGARAGLRPDKVQLFKAGEVIGEEAPAGAIFTPSSAIEIQEFPGVVFKENMLYLMDKARNVMRVLPFSFRNKFIANAKGTNVVTDTDVMLPTTSINVYEGPEMEAQRKLTPEDLNDLTWADANNLLGKFPGKDWRSKFAFDVAQKLGVSLPRRKEKPELNKPSHGTPVVITDPETIKFVRAYPGFFTGVEASGGALIITEITTKFGIFTSEPHGVAGLPRDFTTLFYRLLHPFFTTQENEFNSDVEFGAKEETNFAQKAFYTQKSDDMGSAANIAGGNVSTIGDTIPSYTDKPSANKQLAMGEKSYGQGLEDEQIPELESQKGAGEVSRGMGGYEYSQTLEQAEGANAVKSARLHMLISPEKTAIIKAADPEGKYVRMLVLPKISYISRYGNPSDITSRDGFAIVTGITDPMTNEYLGDKAPLKGREESEIKAEAERLESAAVVARDMDKLGQYIYLPENVTIQDMVLAHQNLLNQFIGAKEGFVVDFTKETLESNNVIRVLRNVISFDKTSDGVFVSGVYNHRTNEWIGQLPYGAKRMTVEEISALSREQAAELGNKINTWLREDRGADVDTLSLDDVSFSDDDIKNRTLLLQTIAQSYLDGFGKTRESIEKSLVETMAANTRRDMNSLFLEDVDARLQRAIDEGAFDPEELALLPRIIQDAVNVFKSGMVYTPIDEQDLSKGWSYGVGVNRNAAGRSGRPLEHLLTRAKQSGLSETEVRSLVDNLSVTTPETSKDSEMLRRVFIDALIRSKRSPEVVETNNEELNVEEARGNRDAEYNRRRLSALFGKIFEQYDSMTQEPFGGSFLDESRPTNTLYGFVSSLSVEGYAGVLGLARRVSLIADSMKLREKSFVSLEGRTEEVKEGRPVEDIFEASLTPEDMGSDYDAQIGLDNEGYFTELDKYETLPTKNKRRTKFEAFINKMAAYRNTLPFISRAVHDIIMREGFGFTSGYRPSMYNGKSNAQLDILFPTIKIKSGSQVGDKGKGKGFLSGTLLNKVFGSLPGIPSSFIQEPVLRQIAQDRYEGILKELERNNMQEFSDAQKVKDVLELYAQEAQAELDKDSEIRAAVKAAGADIEKGTDPKTELNKIAADVARKGSLSKAMLAILEKSPLESLNDAATRITNLLHRIYRLNNVTREQMIEQLLDPVGKFDRTLAPEELINPENDRTRVKDLLFNILLPAFESRAPFNSAAALSEMRKINDPYIKQADRSRMKKVQADVAGAAKYATESGFADAGVSFDSNLLNLEDPRQQKAMEYLRFIARRRGLKNVNFVSNTKEKYPVFTVRGSDNATDPVNSTIFVNPELLADKLFQQKDIKFLDGDARNTYNDLTAALMDQLITHEVAHLSYFEQLRNEYRARFPNGGVSWVSYYNTRVREAADFLRSEDNGLMVKLPGKKAVSVEKALGELYPETKESDEVLVAEFFRILLELDKSQGAKVFTESLELVRSLQVQDRVSNLIQGQSRQQVRNLDTFSRARRRSFLGWLRTVLDSVFNLFKSLKNSSDPRARSLYETYYKINTVYDRFYSDYVAPPSYNEPSSQAPGLNSLGEAIDQARPIGAQPLSAAARAAELYPDGVPTYQEESQKADLSYLANEGAIEAVENVLNELSPEKISMWLTQVGLDSDKPQDVDIGGQPYKLNQRQIVILASYAIRRFNEKGQVKKASELLTFIAQLGKNMGQTISIGYKLLKEFLMYTPAGVVNEYITRLAETRRGVKDKVATQNEEIRKEVRALQDEALGLTLKDKGVQSLIEQINRLYSQALRENNADDIVTIIRNHYEQFSGEDLVKVLSRLLPDYENAPLRFAELAEMVKTNMQTQLGKALSLRGRTLGRKIVNRAGMTIPELRSERIEQLLSEMHEVVKPPISRSGNTLENAIAGDARKILELAALGAINEDVVLSSIDSLGKFPSFDVNTAETLRRMMEEAAELPEGFQRDRKFQEALRVLHGATKSDALPLISAYWYMSMLSGIATFWMNFISTANKAIADIATYSLAAASARGNPLLAAKYMALGYKTFLASMHTIALAEAKGILLHGDINTRTNGKYVDEASINALESMETDTLLKKVLSKGKYIFRIMSASDALFGRSALEGFAAIQAQIQAIENVENGISTLSLEEEAARLLNQTDNFVAYATNRAINDEGLKPGTAEFTKRVYELRDQAILKDPERATIMRRAEDLSLYATYSNEPYGILGNIAKGIGTFSQQHPILGPLFVPFTKIVSNVTNESINYTPIGAYRAFQAWGKAGTNKTSGLAKSVEQLEQIKLIEQGYLYAIQAVLGTAGMLVLAGLSNMLKDKDDDGQDDGFNITGGGPSDPAARKQAREAGYVPYSFSFGGNSVKVSYLSTPLAIPLAIVGTWFDTSNYPRGREKDLSEKLTSAALATVQVPFNQSFLQGLSNLFKMLDGTSEGQDVSALQNFFSGAVGNVVPNIIKQADQIFEPIPQQQTSFVGKWLFNKVPILKSMTGKPQLNVLGEVVNAPAGVERLLFLQRFINTSEADPLFKLLSAKKAFIPDARRGQTVQNYPLNDEQFYRFRELRGRVIAQVVRSPSFFSMAKRMSTEQLDDYLTKLGQKATATAKAQLTPELIRQGVKL